MSKRKTFYLHDMNYTEVAAYLKTCDVVMGPISPWAAMP